MRAINKFLVFVVFICVWASAQAQDTHQHAEVYNPTNPTTLLRIEVLAEVEGRTTVVFVANSDFQPFGSRHYRISDGAPREVFHLRGITSVLEPNDIEVGDDNVIRIRLGLHLEHKPPELHAVFDLTNGGILIEGVSRDGNRLTVSFVAPGAKQTPASITVVPTATPTLTATPTATATATATATPTPTAVATMIATVAAVSTAIPPEALTPAPTMKSPHSIETPGSPIPEATLHLTEDQADEDAMIVSEIAVSRWPDGSTLVRISADRDIPQDRISHFRLFGEPPRYVITVSGAKAPELPGVVDFGDPNLRRVRLIRRSVNEVGELQFVLELAATGATIEKVAHQGAHIALRIVPPPG